MDLTWLMLMVQVSAIVAIVCSVRSMFKKLAENQQRKEASHFIEATVGNFEERHREFSIDFLSVPNNVRIFIGS